MKNLICFTGIVLLVTTISCTMKKQQLSKLGVFTESTDIGNVKHPGSAYFDPDSEVYSIKAAGTNMWFSNDEFYFVYRKVKGDIILNSQIKLIGNGVNPHRKAGLIIRKNFESGSPYVSLAYHGDGLVSMQYRNMKDSITLEFRAKEDSLTTLQLIVSGDSVITQAGMPNLPLEPVGKLVQDFVKDKEYYVGLFVCSHDSDVIEEAHFFNTRLVIPAKSDFIAYTDYIGARLEVLDIASGLRKVIYESDKPVEAPNWSRDGKFFIVNAGGILYRIHADGAGIRPVNTGFANSNNNDHGISPDGSLLVISHHAQDRPSGENSVIYTLPIEGGIPKQITQNSPSYWHGWSPDGKFLIYTAKRNNAWGIYRVPSTGGDEMQLTGTGALDDGSEYSADGKYIWFNSNRTGTMEIWRMKEDGSEPIQITNDSFQNWFPHESPAGDLLVFLSYLPDINLWDHPYYKHVMLRTLKLKNGIPDGEPQVVAYLYGGQGTINVHSWSPDGKKLAFVSNTQILGG
jgi:TolB protein